ncbi:MULTISPECIES: cation diffusion facilitator family transporter [Brevundimonas]|jgi:cobalt-zinc-cadmium efflux system protein|uniref:Cation diffusion facilitator family transporter n=1 Tax=Brevundimonas albigilva TaxID=1312364 RepID=A0ABY4SR63_9CAUL|nr:MULTISPECIES: cation diffusion facilitator family transporter [Brevundimonas]KQR55975.1 cation transporter [Brevundimonas sp. Leaf168]MBA4805525.1 cation transporter [Brevundimonas sp.]MBN9465258.1 cation transporter [Brevundimonas sp.]URI16216.1 cation diffusion facilitator family transporter [Brevundimonas albigilva]
MTNHDHSNGHAHDHTAGANARQLTIALALTGTFLIVEVIGGLVFNSLALLSDAAHMFTDAAALAIALLAIKIGQRPADEKRTFGYRRFEILAAAFNAVLLFVVAGYVLYEGIKRILDPEPVGSIGMLIVAAAGLVINLISMRILSSGKDRSLNVKGAYLEVWADMLGSLGVLVAAVVITVTDWRWVDPIVAIAIGLWVLPRTWILLRDTTHILLEGAPRGVALSDVRVAILATPGVASLHDLHVWVSGADQASCTVHVVLSEGADADAVRQAVGDMLEERFDLHHTTVQTELEPCGDAGGLHV